MENHRRDVHEYNVFEDLDGENCANRRYNEALERVINNVKKVRETLSTDLENIGKINNELKKIKPSKQQMADVLACLCPESWFELDPDSVLREEASWEPIELSEEDVDSILSYVPSSYYDSFGDESKDRINDLIIGEYKKQAEDWLCYTLCCIRFSYTALQFFHAYEEEDRIAMLTEGKTYSKLEGPAARKWMIDYLPNTNRTWYTQLARYVIYDIAMGSATSWEDQYMYAALGDVRVKDEMYNSLIHFRLDPHRVLLVKGSIQDFNTVGLLVSPISPVYSYGVTPRIMGWSPENVMIQKRIETVTGFVTEHHNLAGIILSNICKHLDSQGNTALDSKKLVEDCLNSHHPLEW